MRRFHSSFVFAAMAVAAASIAACGGKDAGLSEASRDAGASDAQALDDSAASSDASENANDGGAGDLADADAAPTQPDAPPPLSCSGGVCTLAVGQNQPSAIAVGGGFLYWTNVANQVRGAGSVARCKLPDCAGGPEVVAIGLSIPTSIAADDDVAVWTQNIDPGPVQACAHASPQQIRTLAFGDNYPTSVLLSNKTAYWSSGDFETLWSCAESGCIPRPTSVLSQLTGIDAIGIGSGVVAYVDHFDWQVRVCALTGCGGAPTILGPGGAFGPAQVLVDGARARVDRQLGGALVPPRRLLR